MRSEEQAMNDEKKASASPARLDPEGTAKPLTEIISHYPAGRVCWPGNVMEERQAEAEDLDDERTEDESLESSDLDDDDDVESAEEEEATKCVPNLAPNREVIAYETVSMGRSKTRLPIVPPDLERVQDASSPELQAPRTRADCEDGPRPCPWVRCRHHLSLVVSAVGSVDMVAWPWEMRETCALDVAAQGSRVLGEVGDLLGLTPERIRQIAANAMGKPLMRVLHEYHLPEDEIVLGEKVMADKARVPREGDTVGELTLTGPWRATRDGKECSATCSCGATTSVLLRSALNGLRSGKRLRCPACLQSGGALPPGAVVGIYRVDGPPGRSGDDIRCPCTCTLCGTPRDVLAGDLRPSGRAARAKRCRSCKKKRASSGASTRKSSQYEPNTKGKSEPS